MSQVFYRKWRPQSLAEVAGQELVTQTLRNALGNGRVSHAYLFCGPRGTGKTSTGRILAKAVNCLSNGKGEPCNTCSMCQEITEGKSLDIIEIDAASNRGIDDIRELRERVNYAPALARYKVYIIDEVHMLSKDAANALLKTLEEPPSHVIFILATTEVHKILPTIMSRCQRFDFKRLSQGDVVAKLTQICQGEKIKIEPESLRLIARSATGSLRDAENLLEQLTTYFGDDVALEQVRNLLGISGDARVKELVRHIVHNDVSAGMKTIMDISNDGLDLKQFNRELIDYLRALLLIKSGSIESPDLTAEDLDELKALATKATLPQVLRAVKLFGQLDYSLDSYSSLPLELALVDCVLPAIDKPGVTGTKVSTLVTPAAKPAAKPKPATESPKPVVAAKSIVKEEPSPAAATPVAPVTASPDAITPELGTELERLVNNWRLIVDKAPPSLKRTPAAAFLRSAGVKPVAIEGDTVVLSSGRDFFKDKLEKPENQKIAESIVSNFLGRPCHIRCVLKPEGNGNLLKAVLQTGAQITSVEEK